MGLLDVVLPERCVACGSAETPLCDGCLRRLVPIREPVCARCGAPVAWPVPRCVECAGRRLGFVHARAAVAYEGVAVDVVRAWKEQGQRRFAGLAANLVVEAVPAPSAHAIAYMPAVRERELWRGHNAARGLAEALASLWGLPVRALVRRAAAGRRQRGLGLAERRANVAGAFVAVAEAPARVVLVDDVYTSGASASAAAAALRRAGARRVEVVTFARTLRRG
jgi:predicted amidophosphoribosyltransferase